MSTLSKPVLTEPAAASAAGCYATCTAYVENKTREVTFASGDKGYRTFSNYLLQAFPANGWTLREFVYTDTWTDTDGNTHTTERHRHPANSGTVYPTTLHTEYETDPADWTSVEPEGKHIDARPTNTFSNVKAYFDAPGTITYTVSASSDPVNGGTVQVGLDEPGTSSSYVVTSGDSVTVVATPSSGYVFDGWYEGSVRISTSTSTTITNVTSNRTFEARFRPLVHIQVATFKSSGRVTLNGAAGVVDSSAYVVAEADIPQGDSVTIGATSLNPSISPFKAWYLDPYAWGNPEGTGTLVSGAGETYTFQASADATYFATFTSPVHIEVGTEVGVLSSQDAPAAVVSINGQSAGGNRYELAVLSGSSVTVEASDYGGVVNDNPLGDVRLYFEGWRPDYDAIIVSADLRYTFQAVGMSYRYMGAVYSRYVEVPTVVMPDASTGSISTTPTAKGGSWFEAFTDVTLRARPSPGYTFIKWTLWEKSNSGRETETFISGDESITVRAGDDYTTLAPTYAYRAYFGRTHLLVNSFDRSTPVQLVYDPATNLLVADY